MRDGVRPHIGKLFDKTASLWLRNRYGRQLADPRLPGDWRRVYHVHVPKTGGTSINHEFLSLGGEDGAEVYTRLTKRRRTHFSRSGHYIFVGWNTSLLKAGHYHFGFSHSPLHRLSFPSGTFLLTCLRDPMERVISYYRMLLDRASGVTLAKGLSAQVEWLGSSFAEFLQNAPEDVLLRQIHMFSEDHDLDTALENLDRCQAVLFTETLSTDLPALGERLLLPLNSRHTRRGLSESSLRPNDLELLRERIRPEILFWEAAAKTYGHSDG